MHAALDGRMIERAVLMVVLAAIVLLYIPTTFYPETDDSTSYSLMAKSFAEGEGYAIKGDPDVKYLPMFPLAAAPFGMVFGFTLGTRIAAFILGMISVIAWFFIGRELFRERKSNPIFLLMFLSPLLVLFSVFRGLSESALICFSLLSLLFFIKAGEKPYLYYPAGLFFGLASMSRHIGIVLGISYLIVLLFTDRKLDRHGAFCLLIGFAIFSSLFIRSYLLFGDPLYTGYEYTLAKEPLLLKIPEHLSVFLPVLLIISGPLLIPFFIAGIKRKNILFLVLIMSGVLLASAGNLRFRYVVPLIPFFLIVAYDGYLSISSRAPGWKNLMYAALILNMLAVPYFANGSFKQAADAVYQTPMTWGQAGLLHSQCVSWVNSNAQESAYVLTRHDEIWGEYLRDDLQVFRYEKIDELSVSEQPGVYVIEDWESDKTYKFLSESDMMIDAISLYGREAVFKTPGGECTVYELKQMY